MSIAEAISAVSALVAAVSFLVGADTYRRQNAAKRFEIFQAFNARFDAPNFKALRELLDISSQSLGTFDHTEKHNLLAFFEEVAIAVNSKIMGRDVAFYFFGYYAILAKQNPHFKEGAGMIDLSGPFWKLFRVFADDMEQRSKSIGPDGIHTPDLRF